MAQVISEAEVIHEQQNNRFVIAGPTGEAELTYEWLDQKSINFIRTYVPLRMRGQGLAERLVEAGLNWASQSGLQHSTCCWFVEQYQADRQS
ncbi:GNAT family N-acetyltransferase [Candidatus Pelagadaptatus aseana]|uniref:GNAT family N-acetyltransferase n=1 Tax=Candidatus Pelagadaptatus aseana TaxID=3120508 RepID=UPI003C6FFBB4